MEKAWIHIALKRVIFVYDRSVVQILKVLMGYCVFQCDIL